MPGHVLLAAAFTASLPMGSASAQLLPHRAFYELSLAERRGYVADARGAFAIEWQRACDGFISHQRLWFVGSTDEGGSFDYDVRFSTWESADNTQMRFVMRSFAGGRLIEEFNGRAEVPADGGPGRAVYTEPGAFEIALPPGTVFPSRHIEALIEHALDGSRVASFDLFDGAGTGDDALAKVTAVIGDPLVAPRAGDGEERAADGVTPAWPIALAYHTLHESDGLGTPLFELSFDLTAEGVMRRATLDYGDFALDAELDEIEMLKAVPCE